MTTPLGPLVVEVLRGNTVESSHQVMAVVVDATGQIVQNYGDSHFLTFPRSAIKMLQALPLVESGAAEYFQLDDKEICMACASHHSEVSHLQVVSQWLQKIHFDESFLVCGPQKPTNEIAGSELIASGEKPRRIMNNCSGKHTGFLTVCRHLNEDPKNYGMYQHPTQQRLRRVLSETMRIDHERLAYGVDGCSIVTYATPLQNIAIGMSALINPNESSDRRSAAKRILQSVVREPFFLAGTGQFTSIVNQQTQGRSIVKVGAEGVFSGLIPERGFAFALKAVDGTTRAAELAAAFLLEKWGGISASEAGALEKFLHPSLIDWNGLVVGQIRVRSN